MTWLEKGVRNAENDLALASTSSTSAFTFLQLLQKQLQATRIQPGFFWCRRMRYIFFVPCCFSVVHLDNKPARNTGEGFCLLPGSVVDLSD